jgi:voltage-gated potassium channel
MVMKNLSLKQTINFYLEDIETKIGKTISFFLLSLILLSSFIFVVETYPIAENYQHILTMLDQGILIIFAIEYILRLISSDQPLKFFFSFFSLIDILAILPLILVGFNISFLRLFRWFRILRIIRFIDVEISIFQIGTEDGKIITRILLILFTIIFIYSGLIYQIEHNVNPDNFVTFLDALYFSIVTMTTVGFGDVTPLSQAGRLVTLMMILTGIIVLPWQLGDLLKQLVKTANKTKIICPQCELSSHDQDAKYCKICGSSLK